MDALRGLYGEMADWLSKPFREEMPIGQILLIFVLFLIVAFIVWDGLKILKQWTEEAAEAVVETVTG